MPRSAKATVDQASIVSPANGDFQRLDRAPSLTARVEQLLREAIAQGRFAEGRLPTEAELAQQLGVSRETVRLAAESLQREGLLVKIRRKGTFLQPPRLPEQLPPVEARLIAYLQAGYSGPAGQPEQTTRTVNGLALQGALEEASHHGLKLLAMHAHHTQLSRVFRELPSKDRLRGIIFAHSGEEKLLRRAVGTGLPIVLLDHDLPLPSVDTVRDDSTAGARQAIALLAELGHKRIAFLNWRQTDLNPWRLEGYRRELRDRNLPRRRVWELPTDITEAGARDAAELFLALHPRPTAVYCFNNSLARLFISALRERGVDVPRDVSVLGGGGEDVPSLTCHQADWFDVGRKAVQSLLRDRTQQPQAVHQLVAHTIIPGQTTAPPPVLS